MYKILDIKLIGDRYLDLYFSNGDRRYYYLKSKEVSMKHILDYKLCTSSVKWANYALTYKTLYNDSIQIENKQIKIIKWKDYKNNFIELTFNNKEVRLLYYEGIAGSKIEYDKIILGGLQVLNIKYILDNSKVTKILENDIFPNIMNITNLKEDMFTVWFENNESYLFNIKKILKHYNKEIIIKDFKKIVLINNNLMINNVNILSNEEIYKYIAYK